ncbi:MAG: response regulator [Bacteroidetes bacterium]|nr:MAG: response regulator [Bacteroidota bacterium]REJ99822.1 MAG: response regulator [Bacteroidota bacterium]REK34195.1 MAG: response regulator [Bacteroidota bacterium]REK50525.1 MAG: response regulator [Bacteroidota bacterium]
MEYKIRHTILVVDDEPDIVEIVSYNLKNNDYKVLKAFSGIQCIKMARIHKPSLIILDVRMPDISGIETCIHLKNDPILKDIPIMFLTADSDEFTSITAMNVGGNHFVTKPIRPSTLISMVNEALH